MKKSVLTFMAVFALTAGAFAAEKEPTNAKWEGNINVYKLGQYLQLSTAQSEEVANISEYLTEQLEKASYSKKNQSEKLHTAIFGNLKLMKQTLTPEQYSKYLKVLNATLTNNGIEVK